MGYKISKPAPTGRRWRLFSNGAKTYILQTWNRLEALISISDQMSCSKSPRMRSNYVLMTCMFAFQHNGLHHPDIDSYVRYRTDKLAN